MAPASRIRRILVGFDASSAATAAAELAIDLASSLHAEVTVLTVLPGVEHLETAEARERALRAAREQLDAPLARSRARATSAGVALEEVSLFDGVPAGQLADYADEHGFDLIVIGSHGRERLMHGGLGRLVEQLLREPRCPVLIAPDRPDR